MEWQAPLLARGIKVNTITKYGLQPGPGFTKHTAQAVGWRFPTYAPEGHKALRWKRVERGEAPRYEWLGKQNGHLLYSGGGLAAAANESPELYWCDGEPDVWTLHSALVDDPALAMWATCYYGTLEQLPAALDLLWGMGYRRITCYADCDEAGMRSAYTLQQARQTEQRIEIVVKRLPGEMGSGFDLNDLWKDCQFDREAFTRALVDCPPIPDVDLWLYAQTAPTGERVSSDLPADWWRKTFREYIAAVEKALGEPVQREGHTPRWHCPLPDHDDAHPSFTVSRAKNPDLPWPICTCGIHHHQDAWEEVGRAVLKQSFADFYRPLLPTRPPSPTGDTPKSSGNGQKPVTTEAGPLTTRQQANTAFLAALHVAPVVAPVENPITTLHRFGGQARVLDMGEMVLVMGASGSGKTSLLESLVIEPLLRAGVHLLMPPGEWTPEKIIGRHVQRAGAATRTQLKLHKLYLHQRAAGVPESQCCPEGRLDAATLAAVERAVKQSSQWAGQQFILPNNLDVFALADYARQKIASAPVSIRVLVVDYIQLFKQRRDVPLVDQVTYLKQQMLPGDGFPGAVTILASQITKESAALWRKTHKALDQAAAQEMREDPVNLVLTGEPVLRKDTAGQILGYEDYGILRVLKNSEGEAPRAVRLFTDYRHLRWIDREWTTSPLGHWTDKDAMQPADKAKEIPT